VLVAPGGPELNLLGGDALSTSGTPRHSLEFNGGLYHKGKGMFLQGTWGAPTRIEASALPGSTDLRFGALTKVNLNLFVELGEQGKLAERSPFLKGLRLSLRFENLFDSRQQVTDGNGLVPLSYQKDYLDPRGRVIEFEVRKMF
jgi:iron complex outermembrane recepter protein